MTVKSQPCRLCGVAVYNERDAHECCVHWEAELRAGRPCPACNASRGAANRAKQEVPWGGPPLPGYPLAEPRA